MHQKLKQEKGDLFRNYSEPVPKASPLVSPDDDTTGAVSYPLTSSERKKITVLARLNHHHHLLLLLLLGEGAKSSPPMGTAS